MIRLFTAIFLVLGANLWAQSNEAYSDAQLQEYLSVQAKMILHRNSLAAKADSMRRALGISELDFQAVMMAVRAGEPWDLVQNNYPVQFAQNFEALMRYRYALREEMKKQLEKELSAIGWTDDFYQHLVLSIEAIPELQERLTTLSIQK